MSISSDAIQKFVESKISENDEILWIGASKASGSLGWSDRSQWGFVPDGSPCCDNVIDGQSGVMVLTAGLGMWRFLPSTDMSSDGFICQYDAV